jgi:hypothetical protein
LAPAINLTLLSTRSIVTFGVRSRLVEPNPPGAAFTPTSFHPVFILTLLAPQAAAVPFTKSRAQDFVGRLLAT